MRNKKMRIGIDFDNTIICYDDVFCELAKSWQLIDKDYHGNKQQIKEMLHARNDGDLLWQKLQGKVYGEFITQAKLFDGFKEFVNKCLTNPEIKLFIVSHKTEFGHFDERKISLREASRKWLHVQGFFDSVKPLIPENHVFFETTREEKIERIKSLQCTHFIDDLVEVLNHPSFPATSVKRFLFLPNSRESEHHSLPTYPSWNHITHAIFSE